MPTRKKTRGNGVASIRKERPGTVQGNRGKGRPKGRPNKLTRDVKEMVLTALNDAGGAEYLRMQAYKNPGAFLVLVGKLLPKQITGENGQPLCAPQFTINPVRSLSDDRLYEIASQGRAAKRE